jgi:hypothetical protein
LKWGKAITLWYKSPYTLAVRQSKNVKVLEFLSFRNGASNIVFLLECGDTSVCDWWLTLRDSKVVSSSKVKKSIKFFTLKDKSTTLSQNVGRQATQRHILAVEKFNVLYFWIYFP